MTRTNGLPAELPLTNPAAKRPSGEQPSSSARLKLELGPDRVGGLAEGVVPPDQAHHLITTFGLLGTGFMGTAGAVLTLYVDPRLPGLALAQLGMALAIAALIAVCGRRQAKRRRRPSAAQTSASPKILAGPRRD